MISSVPVAVASDVPQAAVPHTQDHTDAIDTAAETAAVDALEVQVQGVGEVTAGEGGEGEGEGEEKEGEGEPDTDEDVPPYDSEGECEWPESATAAGGAPLAVGDWAQETPRTLLPLLIRALLQDQNPEVEVPERGWGRVCDVESTTLDVSAACMMAWCSAAVVLVTAWWHPVALVIA